MQPLVAYSGVHPFARRCATLLYGVVLGPPFAARDPSVKAMATLGFLLILLGDHAVGVAGVAPPAPTSCRRRAWSYTVVDVRVNWTQIIGVVFPIVVTAGTAIYLRVTKVGTAMRALANDREVTAMLGVPVRRVEAAAWLGSGLLCGISAGLLLSDLRRAGHRRAHVPRHRRRSPRRSSASFARSG